ncbi:MAG TPA: VOC family protein [Candidatus Limnocylindrales bacterium]|nr:VOC family protein [Candidatus Limnocylindrales bacterium]
MARIRHLAMLTEDVDELVEFYIEGFGLKIVHGVGTATYLTDGHTNLAIIPIGPERKIEGPQLHTGINHFGFEVDDVAALREACKELNAATDVKKRQPNREAEYRVLDPTAIPSIYPNMAGRTETRFTADGLL